VASCPIDELANAPTRLSQRACRTIGACANFKQIVLCVWLH
jgi:hypothetical protein